MKQVQFPLSMFCVLVFVLITSSHLVAASRSVDMFAAEGWVRSILASRSAIKAQKHNRKSYELMLQMEYGQLFACWLACQDDNQVILDPKARTLLLNAVRSASQIVMKEVKNSGDPFFVINYEGASVEKRLKTAAAVWFDGAELKSLGSEEAYREAVNLFHSDAK